MSGWPIDMSEDTAAFLGAENDDPRRVMAKELLDRAITYGQASILLIEILARVDRDLELDSLKPARDRIARVLTAYHQAVGKGQAYAAVVAAWEAR